MNDYISCIFCEHSIKPSVAIPYNARYLAEPDEEAFICPECNKDLNGSSTNGLIIEGGDEDDE